MDCPNETQFEAREQDDGRKLYSCIHCQRVARTTRKHQLPSRTTKSHDKTMSTLFAYAKPLSYASMMIVPAGISVSEAQRVLDRTIRAANGMVYTHAGGWTESDARIAADARA